jgi:tetratricopeptide (TPR) repeat protein
LKKLSPSGSKTLLLSGKIAQQKGNIQEAQKLYESAFNKNPQDLIGMKTLSDVLMRQKLWRSSILHFKKSMEYFPSEPYLLEILGTLLVVCPDTELRNYEEGREYLERAFFHKDCPTETMISSGKSLVKAYAQLGDKQTATAYLKLVIDLAKNLHLPQQYIDKLNETL